MLLVAAFGQVSDPTASTPTDGAPVDRTPGTGDSDYPGTVRALRQFDIPIYAEVDGLLTEVPVKEGMRVAKGQLLASIDERHAQAAVDVADITYQAALARAEDDIERRYAVKAAAVAYVDWQKLLEANARTPDVVPEIEIRQKKLVYDRSVLQIEKAEFDQMLSGRDADVKQAELKAARIALERRRIVAPFDGEIQQLMLNQSEWVNPGDPIMRLVQFDVMQVEFAVPSSEFDPVELDGRPVTLTVTLARGRTASVPGHIVFVNQSLLESDEHYSYYLVRAEVNNEREGDFWLIRPGLPAMVTVHVNQPVVEATNTGEDVEQR
jgi:multidrug efflux pump subunit AcrA (membrane-fusion protein)